MLTLNLLGEFRLWRDGEAITEADWPTRQARQLLKYLLTQPGKVAPSEAIQEAIWPSADPAKTATTLRTAINALRNTLEPDRPPYTTSTYILTERPGYKFALSEAVWLDVLVFENHLNRAATLSDPQARQTALSEAIALYQDDYLSSDPYADWAIAERHRLRERYLQALIDLAETHRQLGQTERAIASLRRVLTRDPGREPVYRHLMRAYMQAGHTVAALRTFETLRTYLIEELGADPAPQTLTLHQAILNGQIDPPPSPSRLSLENQPGPNPETILVGRESEQSQLHRLLTDIGAGQPPGHIVALTGESGAGKTSLAQVMATQAQNTGLCALFVRCQAIEQDLPFAPLLEALEDSLPRHRETLLTQLPQADQRNLAYLLPSLSAHIEPSPTLSDETNQPAPPEEKRRQLVNSLVKGLSEIAQPGLLLVVDDLHWADEATLTVLSTLVRRLKNLPLLLLMTYRPAEVPAEATLNHLLTRLKRHQHFERLALTRLAPNEVAAYLRRLEVPFDRPGVAELHQLTGGNPLFLTETVRSWLDKQAATPLTAVSLTQAGRLSDKIADIVQARLQELPAKASHLLDLAAVIGRDFSAEFLDTVAPTDPLEDLHLLLRRQFLVELSGSKSGRLDFSHQVVREVIYEGLSVLSRQRLHQRVAQALMVLHGKQAHARAADIARHSLQAGTHSRQQALIFSVLAGDYAQRTFGFVQAKHHYQQALTLSESHPDLSQEQADWLRRAFEGLGATLEALADWDGAVETYQRWQRWAKQHGQPQQALIAQNRLAATLGLIGQLDESAAITARLAAQLPPETPPALVEAQRRIALIITAQPEFTPPDADWPGFQSWPVTLNRPWATIAQVMGATQAPQTLNLYGWTLLLQGQTEAAQATLHAASELAQAQGQTGLEAISSHLLAQLWAVRGDYTQMEQAHQHALNLVEEAPHLSWAVIWGRIHQAYVDMRWNQLDRAAARLQALETELAGRTAFRSHRLSVEVALGLLAMFRRDNGRAQAHLQTALSHPQNLYASNYVVAHSCQARLYRYRGNWAAARAYLNRAMDYAGVRGMLADYISALVEAARFDRATGQPERTLPRLKAMATAAETAQLRPALLSIQQVLWRNTHADDHRQQASHLRDSLAATIPNPADRQAYLQRQDFSALQPED